MHLDQQALDSLGRRGEIVESVTHKLLQQVTYKFQVCLLLILY